MLFNECLGRLVARTLAGAAAAGALAALASCGGGTYQVSAFVPARILSFGDESSRLEGSQGLKYSINGVSSTTQQLDCSLKPIWTQVLAASYSQVNLVYANCNPNASFETDAIDLTKVNATVDDVVQQVAAFQAGDTFNPNDLVTIWVGAHDIINEYQANATGDETVLLDDMKAAGATLGNLVNSIAATGAKVLILTTPDLVYSPFGYVESQRGDFDRAKVLTDMTTQFNLGMRLTILNDGSKIGLLQADDIVKNAVRSPGSYSLITLPNQSYGCLDTAPLPTCTSDTLRDDPSTGQPATASFMWADATHLGDVMQNQIGTRAYQLVHSLPF